MSEVSRYLSPTYNPTQFERILVLMRSGRVKRLHCIPTLNEHTVAQHTYGAIIIALHFCETYGAHVDLGKVVRAVAYHDAAELVTGDVPAPIKRRSAAVKEAVMLMEQEFDSKFNLYHSLTPLEQRIVKAADSLDLAFNALHEREMGNHTEHIASVFVNACGYAKETSVQGVDYFIEMLTKEWK